MACWNTSYVGAGSQNNKTVAKNQAKHWKYTRIRDWWVRFLQMLCWISRSLGWTSSSIISVLRTQSSYPSDDSDVGNATYPFKWITRFAVSIILFEAVWKAVEYCWVFLVSSGRLSGWQHISVETSGRLAASATQLPLYCAGRRMGKVFREPNIVCPNSLMSKKALGGKNSLEQAQQQHCSSFSHSNREKIWESIWVRCVFYQGSLTRGGVTTLHWRLCRRWCPIPGSQRFHLRVFVQVAINCIKL